MNIAPAGPRERCCFCAAADELVAKIVTMKAAGPAFREELKTQLTIAFLFGAKRELLPVCTSCRMRLQQAGHTVLGAT